MGAAGRSGHRETGDGSSIVSTTFDVDALGRRVRIDVPGDPRSSHVARVRAAWSGALCDSPSEPELAVPLRLDSRSVDDPDRAFDLGMERLTVEVTLAALASQRGRMLMFHAAGIADATGRVLAFVGPSGRGKTTLSRELGTLHAYVSDETIAVDRAHIVHPYRKPLSLVREGRPKQQVSPVDAGLRPLPDAPLRLSGLALIDRDPSLDAPEVAEVALVEALPELVAQVSYLRDVAHPLQTIAALCDAVGGVVRVRYPDASTVPALLPGLFDHSRHGSAWTPAPDAAPTGSFSSERVTDAIVTDDRVIAMTDTVVHVLDGVAPTIWLTARAGGDLDRIVHSVQAEFGAPPHGDARSRVVAAIDELIAAGLLGRRPG